MNVTLCRYNDYYDYDGDWGWVTANIDEDREQFYNLDIPLTTDDWYFSVFSISKGRTALKRRPQNVEPYL